jgi:hypothetical protein
MLLGCMKIPLALICALVFALGAAPARTTTTATTAPTTRPIPPRRQMVMPPGFRKVAVGSRTALCEDPDQAWVQRVLAQTTPATQPTTMPATLVKMLTDQRALLKGRITGDLSLTDVSSVDKLIDQTLIPQARKMQDLRVPVFYLVCTKQRLRDLVKSGWEDPRFYYNRAADDVFHDPRPRLYDDRPMDDTVLSGVYPAEMKPDDREKYLANVIRGYESAIDQAFSGHVQALTQVALAEFIHKQAIEPLKLKPDQAWFGIGLENVLSSRYIADLTGGDYEQIAGRLMRDRPDNPVRAGSIDLLNPADPATMRPEWMPAYEDALRVKSSRVVHDLVAKAGNTVVPMTLAALRASPPADGKALVRVIAVSSGVDLSNALKAD